MLRLNRLEPTSPVLSRAMSVEGQITGEWALLLERECHALLAADGSIRLDLAAVTYIDRTGVEVLTRLARGSVELVNCLPLIQELLTRSAR
jgi:anti-anti-sigma regulatory factor